MQFTIFRVLLLVVSSHCPSYLAGAAGVASKRSSTIVHMPLVYGSTHLQRPIQQDWTMNGTAPIDELFHVE